MSKNNHIKELIEIGHRLYKSAHIVATEGNLSLRCDDESILVTATGTCLGQLKGYDCVHIDYNGKITDGKQEPTSEYRLHLEVYKGRPEINACCHAHPPYATAIGVTDKEFPQTFLPEMVLSVGSIAMVDYATPGTELLAENLRRYLQGHNAFILRNHGVLTIGHNMTDAFHRMEMVEKAARIAYIALTRGKIKPLGQDELDRLERIGKSTKSDRSFDD